MVPNVIRDLRFLFGSNQNSLTFQNSLKNALQIRPIFHAYFGPTALAEEGRFCTVLMITSAEIILRSISIFVFNSSKFMGLGFESAGTSIRKNCYFLFMKQYNYVHFEGVYIR